VKTAYPDRWAAFNAAVLFNVKDRVSARFPLSSRSHSAGIAAPGAA